MVRRSTTRTVRLGILFLLVAIVAAGAAALPALAAPAPTSLTPHANNTVLTYGNGTIISAVLMDTGSMIAVGGQWVRVERSTTSASGPWELQSLVTTSDEEYASGTYAETVLPVRNTWYRFVFEGTPDYAPSASTALTIKVRPWFGRPESTLRIARGLRFNVKGTLKPHFRAGAHNVTVKVFRLYGHTWKFYMAKKATNHDYRGYTQYKLRMQINKAGQYRFRAYTASTEAFYRGFSRNSRILTVR